jgi:hypothetical protein
MKIREIFVELNEIESRRTELETKIRDVWTDDCAQHNAGNVHYALAIRVYSSMQMFCQLDLLHGWIAQLLLVIGNFDDILGRDRPRRSCLG